MKITTLLPEQFNKLIKAINNTYQACSEGQMVLSRKEFFEIIFDAGRLRMFGLGKCTREEQQAWEKEYDEIFVPWITETYGTPRFYKALKPHFHYERYEF